jgi:hypothetical protein
LDDNFLSSLIFVGEAKRVLDLACSTWTGLPANIRLA